MKNIKCCLRYITTRNFLFVLIILFLAISTAGCIVDMMFPGADPPKFAPGSLFNDNSESVIPDPGEGGSAESAQSQGYLGDESTSGQTGQDGSSGANQGSLKSVGFVNYGEFDAVVMPYTYIPLGGTDPVPPDSTSTVSSANDGVGDWPNSSRFLLLPEGTYTWCIDWEEGDLDEDGQIDYFHYIQSDSTLLDEHDSDQTEFAEEVAISAPPSSGAIHGGRCEPAPINESCEGQSQHVQIYTNPGWIIGSEYQADLRAYGNTAEFPPPEDGITVASSGGHGFQKAWIMTQAGEYLEVTTSNPYTAIGVQPHGDYLIGWARVLFDGVEVWRGDTSAYYHDAEGYMHAVYVEVRCFPPGTHTLRIECLGIEGSGGAKGSGGRTNVPISHFGFRK